VIERHIDYFDPKELRSVHLAGPFVKHFLKRTDDALPLVSAIATLPDGTLLHGRGLNRERGIVFRIPPELMRYIPTIDDCHDFAVADALALLADVWLVDVATDFVGRCILISAALALIQRSLLRNRPAFSITAGRRGGGKTTLLFMLMMAITGMQPAAAAWSPNEEERRKALLSYLMSGVPAIIWDNIPRGSVTDPEQFRALYAYSPYHHVEKGKDYPAVFLSADADDNRVNPMQSLKMAAALQWAANGTRPILLHTTSGIGHGVGIPVDAEIAAKAAGYSFLFRELGMTVMVPSSR
jgi:hypothetical protein